MLTIKYQSAFKKDYKRIVKQGYDIRLLIYEIDGNELILYLTRTGSHSDLF